MRWILLKAKGSIAQDLSRQYIWGRKKKLSMNKNYLYKMLKSESIK